MSSEIKELSAGSRHPAQTGNTVLPQSVIALVEEYNGLNAVLKRE